MNLIISEAYNLIDRLTSENFRVNETNFYLEGFASSLGWKPSDYISVERLSEFANAHLIVEHGLEDSAMISFLKGRNPTNAQEADIKELLTISYNNLVDWHVLVYSDFSDIYYNRTNPPTLITKITHSEDVQKLHRDNFEKIMERRPSSNIPPLDVEIIKSISKWKRAIHANLASKNITVDNKNLSDLFNAIILFRAIEDYSIKHVKMEDRHLGLSMLQLWQDDDIVISSLFDALSIQKNIQPPTFLYDKINILIFDNLDRFIVSELLRDFYRGRSYGYDFSIISKHALSKIYEQYMTIMHYEIFEQPLLISEAAYSNESFDRRFGSVYTPQYIARFFAKLAEDYFDAHSFRYIKSIDPACGSGIFLRSIIEVQLDKYVTTDYDEISNFLKNITGIDYNVNAIKATALSISLLSFALTGRFPERINLTNKESLSYTRSISQKYDLVVANPPFISIERQEPEVREAVLDSLAELGKGRLDTYLAFLKNSIDILEDGGFGFFVIPQSFLVNDISSGVRKYLSENCQIKMICDLSQIEVFQDVGAYVVLLILQKTGRKRHSTLILQARANVGLALYDMLDGRIVDNSSYTIFEVSETAFGSKKWILEKKTQKVNIGTKVQKVGDTFNVSQGFISGNDSVFIRPLNGLENDSKIWVPYMPDRQITPYSTNYKSEMYFFMPYDQDGKIRSERVLEQRYPDTYRYLVGNKEILTQRSLKGYNKQWWEPTWPRTPDSMLITKIITPQVVFLPKFSYDEQGLYAVSHSPFITLKDNDLDSSILKILLGILNSSFYFSILSASSPKYRGGYSRLSAKVLRELEIPHITSMSVDTIRKVLYYIEMISKEKDLKKKQELEFNIDDVINKLIGI